MYVFVWLLTLNFTITPVQAFLPTLERRNFARNI